MKKILCILSSILLISMIFTSCGKKVATNSKVETMTEEEWQQFIASINQDDIIYTDNDFMNFVENSDDLLSDPIQFELENYVVQIPDSDIYEITDDHFIYKINDIFERYELYKGKTIVVEGKYIEMVTNDNSAKYPAVYRLCPGCGDVDGWCGFLLIYNGKKPDYNTWIKVTGKPVIKKTKDGYDNLFLKVTNLELTESGIEYVYN